MVAVRRSHEPDFGPDTTTGLTRAGGCHIEGPRSNIRLRVRYHVMVAGADRLLPRPSRHHSALQCHVGRSGDQYEPRTMMHAAHSSRSGLSAKMRESMGSTSSCLAASRACGTGTRKWALREAEMIVLVPWKARLGCVNNCNSCLASPSPWDSKAEKASPSGPVDRSRMRTTGDSACIRDHTSACPAVAHLDFVGGYLVADEHFARRADDAAVLFRDAARCFLLRVRGRGQAVGWAPHAGLVRVAELVAA